MRLRRAHATVDLDQTDGTALLEAMGAPATSSHLSGYLAAESLVFRVVKGVVDPYVHLGQTTEVMSWAPASGAFELDVTVPDPGPDERCRFRADVSVSSAVTMTQEAEVLPLAALGKWSRTSSRPAPPPKRDWPVLDRWTPAAEAVRVYSGWGHPNLHTDEAFARAAGYERCLVQGLMIQNRGLVGLDAAGELPLPFRMRTRFRAPAFVGDAVAFHVQRAGSDHQLAAVDPRGRVVCEIEVAPT